MSRYSAWFDDDDERPCVEQVRGNIRFIASVVLSTAIGIGLIMAAHTFIGAIWGFIVLIVLVALVMIAS